MSDHDERDDTELLTRLRAADPASSLPPADPHRVAHLVEAAMSDTGTRASGSRESGTRNRSPLTWLVAAAAVVLIGAAVVFGLVNRGDDTPPSAGGPLTQLGYQQHAGRCMLPNVAVLRRQTVAFRGTLTSLEDGTATFDVTRWYAGGPTDVAKVAASPTALDDLVRAARLRVGEEYLVSATGGTVTSCGFTGPASGHLQDLYAQAFGG
ncbi:MAG: hypothetical protein J2P22_03405 [Nocardioides sp.]|nr:hypothetical protein [Nocardioides sp.]